MPPFQGAVGLQANGGCIGDIILSYNDTMWSSVKPPGHFVATPLARGDEGACTGKRIATA